MVSKIESEYYVYIDFRRERIDEEGHRGSLFVNQEIAIATFLMRDGGGAPMHRDGPKGSTEKRAILR